MSSYNYILSNYKPQNRALTKRGTLAYYYGRVVDIVLDSNHPDFEPYGGPLSIGGIRFRPLETSLSEEDPTILPFAYLGNPHYKNYPLKEEIVRLEKYPSKMMNLAPQASDNYYFPLTNIWNQPNHNAFPDQRQFPELPADLGPGPCESPRNCLELEQIGSLQPYPGNTVIEGRHGNTIRFFGFKHPLNIYTDDANNGKPITIFRNGQGTQKLKDSHTVLENINLDDASMYMTSDHSAPLVQAEYKRLAYFPGAEPLPADVYRGKQILENADRIFLNARKDHICLSAGISVGINAIRSVNVDARVHVCLDALKIHLGEKAKWEEEPAVLCNRLRRCLNLLADILDQTAALLMSNPEYEPAAYAAGAWQRGNIPKFRACLNTICSIKVFIEP